MVNAKSQLEEVDSRFHLAPCYDICYMYFSSYFCSFHACIDCYFVENMTIKKQMKVSLQLCCALHLLRKSPILRDRQVF